MTKWRIGNNQDSPACSMVDVVRILETATARVGAQQAAHTLLDQARDRAQAIGRRRVGTETGPTGRDSERATTVGRINGKVAKLESPSGNPVPVIR